jgi:NAD(P)H-nitrite reductase large subunit
MGINWKEEPDETLVCFCSRVDKGTAVAAIRKGANNLKTVQEATGAGVGERCQELNPRGRCCHPDIAALLQFFGKQPSKEK